jgi:AcrR family transcriptional regulator
LEQGLNVPTRDIAEAAGIAEGTLFRVFPTKQELIEAVLGEMLDPSELIRQLRAIDLRDPISQRVEQLVTILLDYGSSLRSMALLLHTAGPTAESWCPQPPNWKTDYFEVHLQTISREIGQVLASEAQRMAVDLMTAAAVVLSLTLSTLFLLPALSRSTPQRTELLRDLIMGALRI